MSLTSSFIGFLYKVLFFNHTIHLDASIGAYCGARGTADARIGPGHHSIPVTTVIDILERKRQHVDRTGDNTKVTALATLHFNNHST